jgi:hypothetical protein
MFTPSLVFVYWMRGSMAAFYDMAGLSTGQTHPTGSSILIALDHNENRCTFL